MIIEDRKKNNKERKPRNISAYDAGSTSYRANQRIKPAEVVHYSIRKFFQQSG